MRKAIYWFRKNLRINDNPSLAEVIKNYDEIIFIYIKNESFYNPLKHDENTIGEFRKKFLDESIINLEKNLKKISIRLYIFDGDFEKHFSNIQKSDRNEFEILDIISSYGLENTIHIPIGRGTAWFDMGTTEDFYSTSSFVKTIQDRQGLLVCSPHEIAFRNKWISEKEFKNYINKIDGSEYSDNLKTIFS